MDAERARAVGVSSSILGLAFIFALAFDYLFYDKMPPGIGFPFYIFLLLAAFIGISVIAKRGIRADQWWLAAALLFFASMVAIRASPLLAVLNILASLLLLALDRKS